MHLLISRWVIYQCTCPCRTECSVLDQNQHDSCAPPSLFTGFHLERLVSLDEKVLKRKCFADVEEVNQKVAEPLKGINSKQVKKLEQWK